MAWEDFSAGFVMLFSFTLFAFPLPFSLLPDTDTGTHSIPKWWNASRKVNASQDRMQGSAAGKQDWFWNPGLLCHMGKWVASLGYCLVGLVVFSSLNDPVVLSMLYLPHPTSDPSLQVEAVAHSGCLTTLCQIPQGQYPAVHSISNCSQLENSHLVLRLELTDR